MRVPVSYLEPASVYCLVTGTSPRVCQGVLEVCKQALANGIASVKKLVSNGPNETCFGSVGSRQGNVTGEEGGISSEP